MGRGRHTSGSCCWLPTTRRITSASSSGGVGCWGLGLPRGNSKPMPPEELEGILRFLRSAEKLKTVTRSGWTSVGEPESVAEHTWRLCLMAMLLYGQSNDVDFARLLKM